MAGVAFANDSLPGTDPVQIFVQCPRCQNRCQVEAAPGGQLVRCPNPTCGQVFKIAAPPAPPPGGVKQVSGSVGSIVPLLGAEEAVPAKPQAPGVVSQSSGHVQDILPLLPAEPAAPVAPPTWHQQPPPVRNANPPAGRGLPPAAASPPPTANPPAAGTGDWRSLPPPSRQAGTGSFARPPASAPPVPPPPPVRAAASPPAPPPVRTPAETMRMRPAPPPAEPERPPPAKNAPETARLAAGKGPADTGRITPGSPTQPAAAGGPIELPPGSWEAPPVRLPGGAPARDGKGASLPTPPDDEAHLARAGKARRRARLIMVGLALLVGGLVGVGFWVVKGVVGQTEGKRFEQAQHAYQEKDFVKAEDLFRSLAKEYPRSARQARYEFLAEFSGVRQPAYTSQSSPRAVKLAYEQFRKFLKAHKDEEQLKEARPDVADTLARLAEQLTDWAEQKADPALLAQARGAFREAQGYRTGKGEDERAKALEDRLAQMDRTIARRREQLRLLDRVKELARKPSGETIQKARTLLREADREQPGVANDPALAGALDRLVAAHRAGVKYTPAKAPADAAAPDEDGAPSLLVAPPLVRGRPLAKASPVLAVARGVLYALKPSSGAVLWAARVGVDTTSLPARLPAYRAQPELILVASSDTSTLSALQAGDGAAVWHCRLSSPCLGRPVVVGRRVYAACSAGRVEEIDADTGRRLGHYDLGQPVSLGGVYDPDANLLYVAADSFCVYALDLTRRTCAAVLYTEHFAGALRSEPVILRWSGGPTEPGRGNAGTRSGLALALADGLGATELRVYALPVGGPNAAPLPLGLRLPGWSWFPPQQDPEKLALVTDAGVLGLYGIKQKHNRDRLLYPLLEKNYRLARGERPAGLPPPGPPQVVYFDESNFWVLAGGALHRLELALGPTGWTLAERWGSPLSLGSPLHAAQVDAERRTLYLVTQPGRGQACVVSAVRADAGSDDKDRVAWQTQLGLACRGDPVPLPGGVLALDQRGALFRFDAASYKDTDTAWHIHEQMAAEPVETEGARPLRLLPVRGGALALVGTRADQPGKLLVRRYDAATDRAADYPCQFPAPPAGTPGAWPDHLVVPMGNGVLARKQIPGGAPVSGPNWRSPRADDNARGHVVPLGAADFLATDGSRTVFRMSWPRDDDNCVEKARKQMAARIVAAPAVVRAGPESSEFRVFVADAENHVTILQGDLKADRLEEVRRLPLGGQLTAGPYALGKGVGCVVDRTRLVLLDADDEKPRWIHAADAEIVGRPALLGDLLVVADLEGRFVGLDPATGQPRGRGYRLKANVAPAAAPVAFGAGNLFTPLTDGTALLLSVQRLRSAKGEK